MALPILIINKRILDSVSMGSTQTSEILDLGESAGYCVHAIWSGTPTGDLLVQGSNDAVNFVSVNTQATGGTAGQLLFNVEKQHYRYVRVQYSFSSSTGTLDCYVSAKRI